jgi:hypothetical protein
MVEFLGRRQKSLDIARLFLYFKGHANYLSLYNNGIPDKAQGQSQMIAVCVINDENAGTSVGGRLWCYFSAETAKISRSEHYLE